MIFFRRVQEAIGRHWVAVFFAVVVGGISVLPQLLAIRALGDEYRGAPFFAADDNMYYLARMHDVLDGYPRISSPFIYEYKHARPLMYPLNEYFYAAPSIVFGLPLTATIVLQKFAYPAFVFLAVYALLYVLTATADARRAARLTGIAGGLSIALGYDLVDYGNALALLAGKAQAMQTFLWARPVNPATGGILLFLFLAMLWRQLMERWRYAFFVSGTLFGLMMSYFFGWATTLSVSGAFAVLLMLRRDWVGMRELLKTFVVGALVSIPYWYNTLRVMGSGAGDVISLRNGMLFTHAPLMNKVLLAALAVYLACFIVEWRARRRDGGELRAQWRFGFAMLLGGLWALNQQVVTGRTIWPFHFVQYTNPLAIIAVFIALFYAIRPRAPKLWAGLMTVAICTALFYGIRVAQSYSHGIAGFRAMQRYAPALEWLSANAPKDCVVLVREGLEEKFVRVIPGFTSCNVYAVQWLNFGMVAEAERIRHSFFALLRVNGVVPDNAKAFLDANIAYVKEYFYRDWNDFLSSDETWITALNVTLAKEYAEFAAKDFKTELQRYRVDYVISDGALPPEAGSALPTLREEARAGEFRIYTF